MRGPAGLLPPTSSSIRPGRRDAVTPNSAEKETTWAVPRFLGITPRVPIAVVVALTGKHFGLVTLDFFSFRFCSDNDRRDIFCWRCFFRDGFCSRFFFPDR